jgi:hypothetical protein
MSLSDRIASVVEAPTCKTCAFYDALPPGDKSAFDEWIAAGRPMIGLHRLCVEEGLTATRSPFGVHIREHHGKS